MRERLTHKDIVNLDMLLVPKGVVLPAEAGVVKTAATIIEGIKLVLDAQSDEIPVVHIEDRQVLDVFNKHAAEMPLSIAILDEVPGGDYDVTFNNYTHLLPSITIGELLEATKGESAEVNAVAQAKMHGKTRPQTDEKVERRSMVIVDRAVNRAIATAPVAVSINRKVAGDPMDEEVDLGDTGQE